MNCSYYMRETIRLEPSEGNPGTRYVLCPWCKHEFSPVTRKLSQSPGGNQLLRCEGDLSRCQLPEGHRISPPA